jgi:Lipid A 3-O-deacylase (PagL)
MREAPARWLSVAGFLIIGGLLGAVSRAGAAESPLPCDGCELRLGVGGTYHFWGRTGGAVIPATLIFDHDRYELGVFRMASRQTVGASDPHASRLLAEPYWGFSASRRWRLVTRSRWRLLFGFGVSYKTESDPLNSTHWNFASQLAVRVRLSDSGSDLEMSVRHWSNGGIRLPNRGQDFATLSYAF